MTAIEWDSKLETIKAENTRQMFLSVAPKRRPFLSLKFFTRWIIIRGYCSNYLEVTRSSESNIPTIRNTRLEFSLKWVLHCIVYKKLSCYSTSYWQTSRLRRVGCPAAWRLSRKSRCHRPAATGTALASAPTRGVTVTASDNEHQAGRSDSDSGEFADLASGNTESLWHCARISTRIDNDSDSETPSTATSARRLGFKLSRSVPGGPLRHSRGSSGRHGHAPAWGSGPLTLTPAACRTDGGVTDSDFFIRQ